MVTDLLNTGVVSMAEDCHCGESGTIRGLYKDGTTVMAIVAWDDDSTFSTMQLVDLTLE